MKTYLELLTTCEDAFRRFQDASSYYDQGTAEYERAKDRLLDAEFALRVYCLSHKVDLEKMWGDLRSRYAGWG